MNIKKTLLLTQLIDNIKTWFELSDEIKNGMKIPIKDSLEILKISKLISEDLDIHQQIFLVNLVEYKWWKKTNNIKIIKKLEVLKSFLNSYVQSRLSWEVTLLKIALEDL